MTTYSITPDDSDMYEGDEHERTSGCYECGGRGWKIVCIDDLCHGMDECIHGDPPIPCSNCNPKGLIPDEF